MPEAKQKILVVEDEPGITDMLTLTLEQAGYRVITAVNGAEGLKKAVADRPDLIVTDVLMPVLDGFQFYKELKKNKWTSSIPVIILTARGRMQETFNLYGADAFLDKPSGSAVLLKKISEILSQPVRCRTPKRVLVAGNYPRIVDRIIRYFEQGAGNAVSVLTGPDVLIQSVLFNPQIIVMDLQMGGPTGSSVQIIRSVRLLPQLRQVPILLYSYIDINDLGLYDVRRKATMIETHQKYCLAAGATKYLGPFEESSFFAKILPYLE